MDEAKILELAREAGIAIDGIDAQVPFFRFARLVAAAERERCALACEQVNETTGECPELALYCADAIRSRTE